ncbi:putative GPI-anchored protein [Sesamum angolense]|uniref:GPI-anchored protein n=1 Tax=Sesamum angolense TaxID=2727404 RepID=A0AAE1W853_9LAMI|nr:putative GPI-anchored protein [Sesamum angolense]
MHKLSSLSYSPRHFSTETVVLQLNSSNTAEQWRLSNNSSSSLYSSTLFSSSNVMFLNVVVEGSLRSKITFSLDLPLKFDKEDNLLQGINQYRASLNLTALTKNDRAGCLADEIADQFKNQPCTNTTGSNTVPGTEPQYSDYPKLLAKCHLNVTTTRDGQIMPACVPNLDSGLVLSNFTKSQYSGYLNGTQYTGIGIGSEDNWIVVVLTTSTPEGDYSPGSNTDNGAASLTPSGISCF